MESNVEFLFYRAYTVFVLLQYLQTSNIQNKGLTVINNYRFELNHVNTFKLLASISQLKVWWLWRV